MCSCDVGSYRVGAGGQCAGSNRVGAVFCKHTVYKTIIRNKTTS